MKQRLCDKKGPLSEPDQISRAQNAPNDDTHARQTKIDPDSPPAAGAAEDSERDAAPFERANTASLAIANQSASGREAITLGM